MSTKQEAADRAARQAIVFELQRTTCVEVPDEPGMFRVASETEAEYMADVAIQVLRQRGALR